MLTCDICEKPIYTKDHLREQQYHTELQSYIFYQFGYLGLNKHISDLCRDCSKEVYAVLNDDKVQKVVRERLIEIINTRGV